MKFITTYHDGVKSFAPFDLGAEEFAEKHQIGRVVHFEHVPPNKLRSKEQNAQSWVWYKEIEEHFGEMPNFAHDHTKLMVGVPILQRDSEKFRSTWELFTKDRDYNELMDFIHHWPITRVFTPKQMSEYLDSMCVYWAKQGLALSER